MAKRMVKAGATSNREYIWIGDSTSTSGAGKTGLAYNTSGLKAYYIRPGGSATAITLATQTVTGAFSSGGFVEVDATNMPGVYRLDIPDAVFASGVDHAIVIVHGASGMSPVPMEYDLTTWTDAATALLDLLDGIESGVTLRQGIRAILAAAAGRATIGATSAVYRNVNNTKDVITATVDASGQRSSVTLDLT